MDIGFLAWILQVCMSSGLSEPTNVSYFVSPWFGPWVTSQISLLELAHLMSVPYILCRDLGLKLFYCFKSVSPFAR